MKSTQSGKKLAKKMIIALICGLVAGLGCILLRENLLASDRQLHIANKKVDNLSIRSLTYKNPTMQKMFKEQKGK